MMLNIVECLKMKDYFYNLGEYIEHEVLIVFPMHEFQIYMKIWKIGLRLSKILLHWKFNLQIDPTYTTRNLSSCKTIKRELKLSYWIFMFKKR